MALPLLPLLLGFVFGSSQADAAPRREQVHVQLQTSAFNLDNFDRDVTGTDPVKTTTIGLGAGGTGLQAGYLIKAPSEVGLRVVFAQATTDNGTTDSKQTNTRLQGYYTHYFRVQKPLRAYAIGLAGIDNTDFDGAMTQKSFLVTGGGGIHYFPSSKASLSAGLELGKSFSGKIEVDGVDGTTDYSRFTAALVGGVNIYIGGKEKKKGKKGKK